MQNTNSYPGNMQGWLNLAQAVVKVAASDYRFALKRLAADPDNKSAQLDAEELETFFRSGWFHILCSLDGDQLIIDMRKEYMK